MVLVVFGIVGGKLSFFTNKILINSKYSDLQMKMKVLQIATEILQKCDGHSCPSKGVRLVVAVFLICTDSANVRSTQRTNNRCPSFMFAFC
jgi:hypothetical protein